MKVKSFENSQQRQWFKGMQMVQFEYPHFSFSSGIGKSPFSHYILTLWGNKNWPPSLKREIFVNSQNISGLKGSNWSTLNAPDTQTPLSHSVLELENLPSLTISSLG